MGGAKKLSGNPETKNDRYDVPRIDRYVGT
jgi:hypothetical protein